ncbi:MAG: glycosyltransferase [Deltaproteobacteria bacterium]|nr:glycosyltransferase [Deltaproteobacteria bacterium]
MSVETLARDETRAPDAARVRMLMMVQNFFLGGTEGQAVELFRRLPSNWDAALACVIKDGPYLATIRELGCEPMELPLRGSVARLNTAAQIAKLASAMRARDVRLVHAHDFYTTLLAVPAAKLAGAKVIVGRLDLGHWPTGLARQLLVWATRAADGVIANAGAIREALVSREGLPADRIRVIHNGIDLAAFDARANAPLTDALPGRPGVKPFVHVANMTHPVKAQEDLFHAVRILRHDHPELSVWLVGDGPRRKKLEALATQLGIGGRVHFLGHRRDVAAILRRAYAGVLCSHAEGLSNALIEYLAAGLPTVASDVGGSGELVADGERGLLVPAANPTALAHAMERLLERPELARGFGGAGRAFVERELTVEQLVARHDAFYREVLQRT